jgi:hypothetical protein
VEQRLPASKLAEEGGGGGGSCFSNSTVARPQHLHFSTLSRRLNSASPPGTITCTESPPALEVGRESAESADLAFTPEHHLTYRLPPEADRKDSQDLYVKYSIDIKEGLDHSAANAATFHYVDKDLMTRMYSILYEYCSE